jgi:type IV secretory pathway TraG/TraD family ATPase VirD4
MDVRISPVYGSILDQNSMSSSRDAFLSIPGKFKGQSTTLNIDKDTLSKHSMLIGGTGCGKSNVFYHIIDQIKRKMTPDDVMIIFDTKGDYYSNFYSGNDAVIGGGNNFASATEKWNIFKEIVADGWEDKEIYLNAQELSWSIFKESIDKSKDPFFPNAARDLFAAVLLCMLHEGRDDLSYRKECLFNHELKRALDESTIFDVKAMIESHPKFASVLSYIGDGSTGQALGVYAEMLGTARKILLSCFDDRGMFSIRDFVRKKGGRVLFIEYDISIGETLTSIYSLLFDLALKEALGRKKSQGDVYLICDEFRLIPYLQHIDDGVNFGRSLGVKVIAGLQSINQLTETYGEYRGKNIIAGFSSVFAFRANDVYTRDYIVGLHGKNVVMEQHKTLTNSIHEERHGAHVVEDWDMNDLEVGEAIVSFPFGKPFRYRFDLFRKGRT